MITTVVAVKCRFLRMLGEQGLLSPLIDMCKGLTSPLMYVDAPADLR